MQRQQSQCARAFGIVLVHAEVNLVLCAGAEDHGVAEDAALT